MDCAGREEQGIEYFTWPSGKDIDVVTQIVAIIKYACPKSHLFQHTDNGLCQYDQGSDFSDLSANEFSDDQNGWWIHNGSQPVWVSGDPQLSPPYPHTNVSQMAGEDFWPPSTQLNYSSDGYSSACSSPDLHVPEIRGKSQHCISLHCWSCPTIVDSCVGGFLGTSRRQTPLMWQFLLRLLFESFQQLNDSSTALLVWLDRESGVFLIRRPRYLAQLWGQVKNKPNMTYPNMARGMR